MDGKPAGGKAEQGTKGAAGCYEEPNHAPELKCLKHIVTDSKPVTCDAAIYTRQGEIPAVLILSVYTEVRAVKNIVR